MVKIIGAILILSGIFSLILGAYIGLEYTSNQKITGDVLLNIIKQPEISLNFYDYMAALVISYSIFSIIVGCVFLFRV